MEKLINEIKEVKNEIINKKDFFKFCQLICDELEKNYILLQEEEFSNYYGTIYVSTSCNIEELENFRGKLSRVIIQEYASEYYEPEKKYFKKNNVRWYYEKIKNNLEQELRNWEKNKEVSDKIKSIIK